VTAPITGVGGWSFGYYEAAAGKLLGRAAGFTAAVLCQPFSNGNQQVIFANSDSATRGWQILISQFTVEARIFHDGPGSISVTHQLDAGGFGKLVLPILMLSEGSLFLIVNGSLVGSTPLPGGTAYLPATTQASLGAGAGGGIPFESGAIVGAAYSDAVFAPPLFRLHWIACRSSRDFVDGQLGSLYGDFIIPAFEHLYSARRGNNGSPANVPMPPFPFIRANPTWPDERGTGGAVDLQRQDVVPPFAPFVVTVRDGS
jgi:hypothetical protein